MIVVLAADGPQRRQPGPAYEVFTGELYELRLRAALEFVPMSRLYLLTFKFGLIGAVERIVPYEQRSHARLSQGFFKWVNSKAHRYKILDEPIYYLASPPFDEAIQKAFADPKRLVGNPDQEVARLRRLAKSRLLV